MKRRDFIQHTISGLILPNFLNGFSINTIGNIPLNQLKNDNILVVIQLKGGNDGLNTVVPIDKYDLYYEARKNIAIPENKLLKISQTDTLGLHPSMSGGLHNLFQEGRAALIQSVGYPNPSFSHFKSTDIWNSASDKDSNIHTGWLGRYLSLQNLDSTNKHPLAIQIGSTLSTSLQGSSYPMGVLVSDPSKFLPLSESQNDIQQDALVSQELSYLNEITKQTNKYATSILSASEKGRNLVNYPSNNRLAEQLKIVAKLIGGGLNTKIYFVSLQGFDTHSNQVNQIDKSTGTHANLWAQISDAVKSFTDDLKAMGTSKRVIGMTYSEFGRRIKSNASGGTDHGAAAPMFLFGDMINPVVLGTTPEIPVTPHTSDNVIMQYDFRSVYNSLLEQVLGADKKDQAYILLDSHFQSLPLTHLSPLSVTDVNAINKGSALSNLELVNNTLTLTFLSSSGYNLIQIFDNASRLINVPINANYPKGAHNVSIDTSKWKNGIYYVRFQNEAFQQIKKFQKES